MTVLLHWSSGFMPLASLASRVAKSRAWLAQSASRQGRHMLLPWLDTGRTGHT